ncbi:type VII secretion protein EccC [Klugiella xanthotipulae]|uniref:S-DNA-T family DNA segregation ATPase FtsK/SpoIIIE n=1 Tax=Klugiella xanthotipulae TaxID=244735 RepID=A0A543I5U2_9MICO|nr:type VII secretion protein EccCa [Klugiella xanthotipulae]TQM65965.1 S-DNA-T family DNA segregation ATPase FtsK/SpoIIIE [Klugiella xanthotipulae]
MSSRIIHRPARITTPVTAPEPTELAPPPQLGDAPVGGIPLQSLLPVVGSLSSITMIVVLRANPIMVVIGAMILVVALVGGVGMALSQKGNATRQRKRSRERYLDYLEKLRATLRGERDAARARAEQLDPEPVALTDIIRNPERVWERRRRDADYLRVRVGTGVVAWFGVEAPVDPNPVQPFDPIMVTEATQLSDNYSAVPGMPVTVALKDADRVSIVGSPAEVYETARALVVQLATLHSPDDVQLGFVYPPGNAAHWYGVDLLPHTLCADLWDGPVPARRVAPSTQALYGVIGGELMDRAGRAHARARSTGGTHSESALIVFVDDTGRVASPIPIPEGIQDFSQLGITFVHLVTDRVHEPTEVHVRIVHHNGTLSIRDTRTDINTHEVAPDPVGPDLFAGIAGMLAPLRLSVSSREEGEEARDIDVTELLGIGSIAQVSPAGWTARSPRDFLRVPVGLDDLGRPVHIDVKESAQSGMGPHGICIGATGSGKSEFLRTLILGLALTHSPEDLAMILVDYKGGAAFSPFQGLPHIAGLIDNLADDAQLTERARASIAGEVVRRQQQLKDAGSMASITQYREARCLNPDLPPMPHLFVVIDEFGELLTAEPEFIDLLLTIGRIGRSIGVHMLLSSQRIEGGKLRGLDTYLSYRLGLRTFSEQESSVVLNTPDAFHLPAIPGFGYLKVDTSIYTRFKAGYVSGPVPTDSREPVEESERFGVLVQPPFNTIATTVDGSDIPAEDVVVARPNTGPSLIDETVARLRPGTTVTAPVWLPPLPDRLALFQVINNPHRAPLSIPLGLIDNPSQQTQDPWEVDLGGNGGHFAIIGAPQSGRSTFLRTFAAATATVNTPRQVTMYGMDLTGNGLARLDGFPHVGGVATRNNREQLVRLLEEIGGMVAQREAIFREHRIESLAQFRSKHEAGQLPRIISPDVILLIDGYGMVRTDFEELEAPLTDLLTRGGSFGIHLVLGLTRWNELKMNLQPLIGNKFELRLNDPTESVIARKLAETIRSTQPGRVITEDKLFAQVALPVIDDVDDESIGDALSELAKQSAASWAGPGASPIRLLPEDLDPATLPDIFDEPDAVPIGLRQDTMEPALLDLGGRDQHLLVLGDTESGKTTLLRHVMNGLIERHTPDELVIALMDPRGDLARACPDEYLGGHANNSIKAKELGASLAQELEKRQNGESSAALRIVVMVDDYDILAPGGANPLEYLLPYLPSSRDLGLNVLLTRPVAGAARALYENTIQTLKDTGATGIILAGERSEGALWPGVHAAQAPPGRAKLVRRGQPTRLIQIANATVSSPGPGG